MAGKKRPTEVRKAKGKYGNQRGFMIPETGSHTGIRGAVRIRRRNELAKNGLTKGICGWKRVFGKMTDRNTKTRKEEQRS